MTEDRARRGVFLLFLFCVFLEVRFTVDSVRRELNVTTRSQVPFTIKTPGATLDSLKPEAKAAGLKQGDRPVSMDGRAIPGPGPILAIARRHHAGDVVDVQVSRDGATVATKVTLAPVSAKPMATSDWVLVVFLLWLTPFFCMALGLSVAYLRPRDPLAWLLALLMLSFSQISQGDTMVTVAGAWDDWMQPLAVFFQSFLSGTWGVWMLLFGQYFPNRKADRTWDRILRWALAWPLLLIAVMVAIVNTAAIQDATAFDAAQRGLSKFAPVLVAMMMIAISTFFINILRKSAHAKSKDERRRLKLLYWGTFASLTPLFLIVIAQLVFKKSLTNSDWVVIPALLALFLFPLTLTYVVVVERAMEMSVAVRQGLQYALARRGLRVLMVIVIMTLMLVTMRIVTDPGVSKPQKLLTLALLIVVSIRLRQGLDTLRGWVDRQFFREAVNTEKVLQELGENVRSIVEVQPLLATVTNTISNALHVPRVAMMMLQHGDFVPAYALGYSPQPIVKFSDKDGVAAKFEKSREPLRVSKSRPEPWMDHNIEALGAELVLPLAVKDRLLGFLSLGPKISEEPFTPTDIALLQSVASQTGLALENSRLTEAVASEVSARERLNRELEIAREVQQRLFPQSGPQVAGLDYAGKCRPASSVGGDYYDFVAMCDGRLGIAIGDISGKGVPAALLMASLQASLRGLAISNPPALSPLMTNLNRLIYDASPSNRYATFFYGVYDPNSREFMYVNGGHNPPMIFRGGEVARLEEGGPVVGLFGPAQYTQGIVTLEHGDTMVLFTDGVSEAMNNEDEEFDEERLIAAVRGGAGLRPAELIDRVFEACDEFAAGAPQHDDMTMVAVRVE